MKCININQCKPGGFSNVEITKIINDSIFNFAQSVKPQSHLVAALTQRGFNIKERLKIQGNLSNFTLRMVLIQPLFLTLSPLLSVMNFSSDSMPSNIIDIFSSPGQSATNKQ